MLHSIIGVTLYLFYYYLSFQDGTLSKEEVLDKYDLFVGSQATDFGMALTRHEELWLETFN